MGSRNSRICIWSQYDVENYRDFGTMPNCGPDRDHEHHEHISRSDALGLVQQLLYTERKTTDAVGKVKVSFIHHYEASWVNGPGLKKNQVIVMNDPRDWAIRPSDGFDSHQLIHVGK